jgi:hypothetical protein
MTRMNHADLYGEIGEDYRYHLGWRERLLAGFVTAVGLLAVAFHQTSGPYRWALAIAGSVISLAIFFLEERCHEVLLDRRQVGVELEKTAGFQGLHSSALRLQKDARVFTHTDVLRTLYLGGAVLCLAVGLLAAKAERTPSTLALVFGQAMGDTIYAVVVVGVAGALVLFIAYALVLLWRKNLIH